jgi:integrase
VVFGCQLGGQTDRRAGAFLPGPAIFLFKAILRRAELPDIRFHDLRHSCASLLVAQGVHPRLVMEILGHSTIILTMNTYAHIMSEAQRQALSVMDGLFAPAAQVGD